MCVLRVQLLRELVVLSQPVQSVWQGRVYGHSACGHRSPWCAMQVQARFQVHWARSVDDLLRPCCGCPPVKCSHPRIHSQLTHAPVHVVAQRVQPCARQEAGLAHAAAHDLAHAARTVDEVGGACARVVWLVRRLVGWLGGQASGWTGSYANQLGGVGGRWRHVQVGAKATPCLLPFLTPGSLKALAVNPSPSPTQQQRAHGAAQALGQADGDGVKQGPNVPWPIRLACAW